MTYYFEMIRDGAVERYPVAGPIPTFVPASGYYDRLYSAKCFISALFGNSGAAICYWLDNYCLEQEDEDSFHWVKRENLPIGCYFSKGRK